MLGATVTVGPHRRLIPLVGRKCRTVQDGYGIFIAEECAQKQRWMMGLLGLAVGVGSVWFMRR